MNFIKIAHIVSLPYVNMSLQIFSPSSHPLDFAGVVNATFFLFLVKSDIFEGVFLNILLDMEEKVESTALS